MKILKDAETEIGRFEKPCSDCGMGKQVFFKHTGRFVPNGKIGFFDRLCLRARAIDYAIGMGSFAKPLNRELL